MEIRNPPYLNIINVIKGRAQQTALLCTSMTLINDKKPFTIPLAERVDIVLHTNTVLKRVYA